MHCSIIIPIYNPSPQIASAVKEHFQALQKQLNHDAELIMVDDGSDTDIDFLKNMAAEIDNAHLVLQKPNQGKGAALRNGMAYANGEIILYTDNDFPYKIESMIKVIDALKTDTKVVIGIRPKSYFSKIPFKRKLISYILKTMNSLFMSLPTSDTQAGLKAFKKELIPLFLSTRTNGFLFDLEFLQKIKKQQIDSTLVEIELRDGIELSDVRLGSLWNELKTYVGLIFG